MLALCVSDCEWVGIVSSGCISDTESFLLTTIHIFRDNRDHLECQESQENPENLETLASLYVHVQMAHINSHLLVLKFYKYIQ